MAQKAGTARSPVQEREPEAARQADTVRSSTSGALAAGSTLPTAAIDGPASDASGRSAAVSPVQQLQDSAPLADPQPAVTTSPSSQRAQSNSTPVAAGRELPGERQSADSASAGALFQSPLMTAPNGDAQRGFDGEWLLAAGPALITGAAGATLFRRKVRPDLFICALLHVAVQCCSSAPALKPALHVTLLSVLDFSQNYANVIC